MLKGYVAELYRLRYFWLNLARSDLSNRFRRSKLGILWSMLTPLFLTIIIATVFGTIFNTPMLELAPFILSGVIVWDIIVSSFVGGSNAILSSEQYIRQASHPLSIYTLRWAIVTCATFLIALMSLIIWMLFVSPTHIWVGLVVLPLNLLVYLILSWSITTFSAFINTKYRDYPQIIALLVQMLWFLSPVFFQRELFMANPALERWFYYNPITHLLELIRAPFLYGSLPTLRNYAISLMFALGWALIAMLTSRLLKSKVIFYI